MKTNEGVDAMLYSYIRAWARHRIVIALASQEAAVRAGLAAGEAAALFGAGCVTVGHQGVSGLAALPADCPVDVIVDDPALMYRFPYGYPDPLRRGMVNEGFLAPRPFVDRLAPVLDALGPRVRLVVLQLAPVYATEGLPADRFLECLGRLLVALPRGYRYAWETANAAYLQLAYCDLLRNHGAVPIAGEGDGVVQMMPSLSDQLAIPGVCAPSCSVVRSTIQRCIPGMAWRRLDPAVRRQGWCDAVRRSLALSSTLYLMIDDETDPLHSLALTMDMLNADLARRSPLRTMAA